MGFHIGLVEASSAEPVLGISCAEGAMSRISSEAGLIISDMLQRFPLQESIILQYV